MGRARPPYPPEFRRQMVELVRAGRGPEELAREFEPSAESIRNWVRQTDRDEGLRNDGLTTAEKAELRLSDADLTGADLREANLKGAQLGRADLGNANLEGANLTDANLSDANLEGANLRDTILEPAKPWWKKLLG